MGQTLGRLCLLDQLWKEGAGRAYSLSWDGADVLQAETEPQPPFQTETGLHGCLLDTPLPQPRYYLFEPDLQVALAQLRVVAKGLVNQQLLIHMDLPMGKEPRPELLSGPFWGQVPTGSQKRAGEEQRSQCTPARQEPPTSRMGEAEGRTPSTRPGPAGTSQAAGPDPTLPYACYVRGLLQSPPEQQTCK